MNKFIKYLTLVALLLSVSVVSAQNDEKTIRKGNRQYRREHYENAVEKYKEVLETTPNNTKAQFNLGDAYYGMQLYDSAYAAFEKVVEMSPDAKLKSDAVFNMGNCLLAQDKYYDAYNIYKVSLKLNPENKDALYNLEYCRAHLVKSKIYVVQPEHGTVETSQTEAFNGQHIALKAQPEDGYALKQYIVVRADRQEVAVEADEKGFIMPKFDVLVTAEFDKNDNKDNQKQDQQQQQDQQNQDQQQNQQQQDQQDQQQDQKDQQQDQQNQQDQQKQDQQGQQDQQKQQQQQQQQQMSKDDAQRMLDALENQEKKTMEKVNEQKVRQQPKKKSDKDW